MLSSEVEWDLQLSAAFSATSCPPHLSPALTPTAVPCFASSLCCCCRQGNTFTWINAASAAHVLPCNEDLTGPRNPRVSRSSSRGELVLECCCKTRPLCLKEIHKGHSAHQPGFVLLPQPIALNQTRWFFQMTRGVL